MTDICPACGKECAMIKGDLNDRKENGVLDPHKCKVVKSSGGEEHGNK